MAKKKKEFDKKGLRRVLPYALVGIATVAVVFVGSLDKQIGGTSLSLNAFAANDYKVSVDQLTELYVVADVSDALGFASARDTASNYVVTMSMYDAGQTSVGKLEKPSITNVTVSRGVIEYTVKDGDTMAAIASKYGITTDDIRWSNDIKYEDDISAGDLLYLPSVSGIVYTVKADETASSIAEKYGSTATEIIAMNDLEVSGVSEGMRIVIKGGVLPETERPEYEPPVVQTYYYTYLGSSSERQNIEVLGFFYDLGGPYAGGQCTQWAWSKRPDLPSNLGNASAWAYNAAAAGFLVDRTPSAGAIFQTSSGWYGHVGYVEYVNADGSIVATEMNYGYTPWRAIRSTIPASTAATFNYIH